jgi:tellurite resistance protein
MTTKSTFDSIERARSGFYLNFRRESASLITSVQSVTVNTSKKMKGIIIVVALIALASGAKLPSQRKTLNQWLQLVTNFASELGLDIDDPDVSEKLSRACIREKLNVEVNGDKPVKAIRGLVAIALATAQCIGDDEKEEKTQMAMMMAMSQQKEYEKNVSDCFMMELHKISPEDPLLTTFDSSSMTSTQEECNKVTFINYIDTFMEIIEDIEEFTCGIINDVEVKREWLKVNVLMRSDSDVMVKVEEASKMMKESENQIDELLKCMLGKM